MKHLLPLALLCAALSAQQDIRWNSTTTPGGGRNAFPWGSAGIRYQSIVPGSIVGNLPARIQDIIVPGDINDTAPREVIYDDIEIIMGATPATTLSPTWSANNPNPTTVYRGPLRVVFEANAWRSLGLPLSFVFVPTAQAPNLCVEVIVWAVRGQTVPSNFFFPANDTAVQRAYLLNWINNQANPANVGTGGGKFGLVFNSGNYVILGEGCINSNNTRGQVAGPTNAWPTQGQVFTVSLSNSKPNSPSFFALGSNDRQWGSLQLPFDLGVIGAAGCLVWHDIAATVPMISNASGGATFPMPIPADISLIGARAFTSWLQLDPAANPLGLTTSSFMKWIIG